MAVSLPRDAQARRTERSRDGSLPQPSHLLHRRGGGLRARGIRCFPLVPRPTNPSRGMKNEVVGASLSPAIANRIGPASAARAWDPRLVRWGDCLLTPPRHVASVSLPPPASLAATAPPDRAGRRAGSGSQPTDAARPTVHFGCPGARLQQNRARNPSSEGAASLHRDVGVATSCRWCRVHLGVGPFTWAGNERR